MRAWRPAISFAILALLGWAALASSTPPSTATCGSIIFPGGPISWRPERVVLGVAAVPPAYIPQTVPFPSPIWPYWSKWGLVIRADSPPVLVSLPQRWRNRAAIAWGDARPASEIRIASCPRSGALGRWNPYAGGFYLRSQAACLPLVFRVGKRTATVRFGVGKRCA